MPKHGQRAHTRRVLLACLAATLVLGAGLRANLAGPPAQHLPAKHCVKAPTCQQWQAADSCDMGTAQAPAAGLPELQTSGTVHPFPDGTRFEIHSEFSLHNRPPPAA